jgi:tRNA pseudouridine13 synthase
MTEDTAPLAYLYGKPGATAVIRLQPEDFIVDEVLNFTPSGAGEHILLQIEKTGQNTQYVAKQLAAQAGVRTRDVSYAGLKDRHAVTRQWFCLKWPIKQELPYLHWQLEGCRILQVQRHYRKLRLGALKCNRFSIRLCQVSDTDDVLKRVEQVRQGVANYYGEQRFGIGGGNLQLAERLFRGESIPDRKLRGLALSASRSFLFNQVVSARISQQSFRHILHGDILQLDGSGSVFAVTNSDSILEQRLAQYDIHLTAPLAGSGNIMVTGQAAEFEQQVLRPWQHWVNGLINLRVKAERRSMRLVPQQLVADADGQDIVLQFALPVGCFATSILRELVDYQDQSRSFAVPAGEQEL